MKMRPTLEHLENKILPASIYLASNTLIVAGDNRSELLIVEHTYNRVNAVVINISTGMIESQDCFMPYEIVDLLMIGGSGNDIIINKFDHIYSTLIGNGGNDVIIGSRTDDRIIGSEGNDVIFGNGGNDFIYGNGGNDFVSANDGSVVIGGSGTNSLISTSGCTCVNCKKKVINESDMNKINESNMMSNINFTTQQKKDFSFFLNNRKKATNLVNTVL